MEDPRIAPSTQVKTLAELATVSPGFSPASNERRKTGRYLLLGGRNIKGGKLVTTSADSYIDTIDRQSFRRSIVKPGDIIVATLFERRKLYRYKAGDPPAVVNSSCAIIRAGPDSDYIASYLRTLTGERDFLDKASKATRGTVIPRISTKDLEKIQIPILPVAQLQQLGDASMEQATDAELLDIKKELEAKQAEILQLRAEKYNLVEFYEDRLRAVSQHLAANTLASRIKHGETESLEFKSTLRWNLKINKIDREIENAVVKAIVAFCNSAGGELLIGVADDKSVVGTALDGFGNDDKFQLHLCNLLRNRIEPSVADLVKYEMVTIDEKTICQVTCTPSRSTPIWFRPEMNSHEEFYVRFGPSSTKLSARNTVAYIREHFEESQQRP